MSIKQLRWLLWIGLSFNIGGLLAAFAMQVKDVHFETVVFGADFALVALAVFTLIEMVVVFMAWLELRKKPWSDVTRGSLHSAADLETA